MPSALVRYDLGDGRSILFEAEIGGEDMGKRRAKSREQGFSRAGNEPEGYERAGIADVVQLAPEKLKSALESVGITAELVFEQVKKISPAPKEVTIELSVKFTVKGDVIVAKGEAEGNCKLALKW